MHSRHGGLPAWGTATLPTPPAFTTHNILRTIGPGIIGLGIAIGSGEWLLGPSVVVTYGAALLWIASVSVLLQVLLNLEMVRYTLYTGEPIMTGYMRTWPGPSFWGWTYSALGVLQYGWPGWALASATATAALVLGRIPGDGDAGLVTAIGYVTFAACFAIVLVGRKVERTIELVMAFMLAFVFLYLLLVDLFTVSGEHWASVLSGFTSVGTLPAGANWPLIAAFAAYSGLGGVGNAFITNWMRDKGYAMGATVGYIPSACATGVKLSPQGNIFQVDERSLADWRGWWRFANLDQWLIFGVGSVLGMALTVLITLQYVPAGAAIGGWAAADLQASGMAEAHGSLFWSLTLICGLWILFSSQLAIVDGLPRMTTDMLWSASSRVRQWRGGDVRGVYYVVLLAFAVWGCLALNLAQPLTLIVVGANVAAFTFCLEGVHTIVVNRRVLPAALRPPRWREACVLACAVFYGGFVVAAATSLLG